MTSSWHHIQDSKVFYELTLEFFCQQEAIYNLPLGVAGRLRSNPKVFGDSHFLYVLTLEERLDSSVIGAAWWTPPYPFGFSKLTSSEVSSFFSSQKLPSLPKSLVGPSETVALVAANIGGGWSRYPQDLELQDQGIYRLQDLTDKFVDVKGKARFASLDDFELVLSWSEQFLIECKSIRPNNFETHVRTALTEQTRALWMNDGKPVAMAGTAGQTPNGGRIAWVYTPPEYRGNGYAGAITRFLTHQQLISGKKFCFLYTDMANPTSNSIYQKLGYVYVGSSQHATLS
jgi:hypothetical protein